MSDKDLMMSPLSTSKLPRHFTLIESIQKLKPKLLFFHFFPQSIETFLFNSHVILSKVDHPDSNTRKMLHLHS